MVDKAKCDVREADNLWHQRQIIITKNVKIYTYNKSRGNAYAIKRHNIIKQSEIMEEKTELN